MSATAEYPVTGMTCGHCVGAVREELSALGGVEEVVVDLQAGGVSRVRVRSAEALTDARVAGALDEAGGYHLAGPGQPA
jgi:copper chaperone CopZ